MRFLKRSIKVKRIVLGTAQFGMDYGINNPRGKVPKEEALNILRDAVSAGINIFDTASGYGESEQLLGEFIRSSAKEIKIISKLPKCSYVDVDKILESSFEKTGMDRLYGYLIHDFSGYKDDPRIFSELLDARKSGKIEQIGFSLYLSEELDLVLRDKLPIDIVQFPYNVFDQRFREYFSELKKRKIDIYVRSIFLQGLVFMKPGALPQYFNPLRGRLEKLQLISKEYGIPIYSLCLVFALANKLIDNVVVGVDNSEQFHELRRSALSKIDNSQIVNDLSELRIDDEAMILPFKWPKR